MHELRVHIVESVARCKHYTMSGLAPIGAGGLRILAHCVTGLSKIIIRRSDKAILRSEGGNLGDTKSPWTTLRLFNCLLKGQGIYLVWSSWLTSYINLIFPNIESQISLQSWIVHPAYQDNICSPPRLHIHFLRRRPKEAPIRIPASKLGTMCGIRTYYCSSGCECEFYYLAVPCEIYRQTFAQTHKPFAIHIWVVAEPSHAHKEFVQTRYDGDELRFFVINRDHVDDKEGKERVPILQCKGRGEARPMSRPYVMQQFSAKFHRELRGDMEEPVKGTSWWSGWLGSEGKDERHWIWFGYKDTDGACGDA